MIEFVSYDGKFPTLCEGLLVVRIDGRLYAFSPYYDSMYRSFWNRFNRTEALEDDSITKVFGFYLESDGYIDWGENRESPKIVEGKWTIDDETMKLENVERVYPIRRTEVRTRKRDQPEHRIWMLWRMYLTSQTKRATGCPAALYNHSREWPE